MPFHFDLHITAGFVFGLAILGVVRLVRAGQGFAKPASDGRGVETFVYGAMIFYIFGAAAQMLAKTTVHWAVAACGLALLVTSISTSLTLVLLDYAKELTRSFSDHWVAALGWLWFVLGLGGMIRLERWSTRLDDGTWELDPLGFLVVAVAISIGLSKVTIETYFKGCFATDTLR